MLQNAFSKGLLWLGSDCSRTSVSSASATPVSLFWPFLNVADSIFLKKETRRKLSTIEESLAILCFQKNHYISHTGSCAMSSINAHQKNDPFHKNFRVLCFQAWKDVLQQISILKIRFCTKELTHWALICWRVKIPKFSQQSITWTILYRLSFSSCLKDK